MSNIPAGTRFIGIAPTVNLKERKSALINAETQPYTLEDISGSSGSPIFQPDIISYGGTTMGGIAIDISDYAPIVFWSRQMLAPNLTTIYGTIYMRESGSYGSAILNTISMPLLESVGSLVANGDLSARPIVITDFPYLETIDFGNLTTIHFNNGDPNADYLEITYNPILTTLNISNLQSLSGGNIYMNGNASLTNFSIAQLITFNGDFSASACALNQSTIDAILYQFAVVLNLQNHSVYLDGGANAAPSVTGSGYVATLIANGCTVTTN